MGGADRRDKHCRAYMYSLSLATKSLATLSYRPMDYKACSCGVLAHHSCYRTRTREVAQAAVRVQQGEIRHILYLER